MMTTSRWTSWSAAALAAAGLGASGCNDESNQPEGFGPSEQKSCPDAAFPLTLQAENAELRGVSRATELTGFEGEGYVGGFDEIGDSITFELCVSERDYYTMSFRYANGSEEQTYRTLYVDDQLIAGEHTFPARWLANDWEPHQPTDQARDSVLLEAGTHRITLSFEPIDTGSMALDSMTVRRGAEPSATSVTSVLANDWSQLVAGVLGSRIYPEDDHDNPPRIAELRWRGNWEANNLDTAAGFLRDLTLNRAWVNFDRQPMNTNITTRDDGIVQMDYLNWGDNPLPAAVVKEHALVPESGIMVVRYNLTNVTDIGRDMSMLEYVDLNRFGTIGGLEIIDATAEPPEVEGTMRVEWREDLQAFIADLSELHGTYVVFGTFEPAAARSTGPAGGGLVSGPSSGSGSSGGQGQPLGSFVEQFAADGTIEEREKANVDDAAMAIIQHVSVAPGDTASFSFFYAVRGDLASAEDAARTARSESAAQWIDRTGQAWKAWLDRRAPLALEQEGLQEAYRTALVSIKHAQQPEFGSFVAATNPAYRYKVWPRDASVVAMGLDATGYLDEAEAYWRWMASVQETGEEEDFPPGTWWTNYSYWQADEGIPFVQPEWDSLGLFTIGAYRHFLSLRETRSEEEAKAFLEEVWPAVERAATFINQGIDETGFGPPDFSIWEDRFQYALFTQVTYASGLVAAYELAVASGKDGSQYEPWRIGAETIREAILKPYDEAACTGLWLPDEGYFMRGIDPDDCTADRRIDASTDLMWVFGLIDAQQEQARQHRMAVLRRLTPTDYYQGISRYEDDAFYYTSIYSPGGTFESNVPETTWPQMSMYMSMAEHWLGFKQLAQVRLDWYTSITGVGHMPPGEGIDWSTQQPLVSTAVEPVTGTWFLLAALVNANQYEPRLDRVGVDSGK